MTNGVYSPATDPASLEKPLLRIGQAVMWCEKRGTKKNPFGISRSDRCRGKISRCILTCAQSAKIMKKRPLFHTLLAFAAASSLLRAQPGPGIQNGNGQPDLNYLMAQQEKALTAATDPIHRLYQSGLLLMRQEALRTGDADLVTKINAQLSLPDGKANPPDAKPKTPQALAAFLAGTVWTITNENENPANAKSYTLTFLKNGKFLHSDGRIGDWTATSARDLKLWNWDPATFNDDLTQFRAVGTGVIYFGKITVNPIVTPVKTD